MRFSYLIQRGNLYYFQYRVPADMKHYFPGTQIRKSLKTDIVTGVTFISFAVNAVLAWGLVLGEWGAASNGHRRGGAEFRAEV